MKDGDRPLSARSVIGSTLLGMPSRRLDTATLVRSGELFGIAAGATRVALSRMRRAGEIEAEGDGYRLAGHLVHRQARQSVSRRGVATRWDGSWLLHVVSTDARPSDQRAELRRVMKDGRRAELREGVWLRPDNLGPEAFDPGPAKIVERQCRAFTGHPAQPAALAAELWDLAGWSGRAGLLIDRLDAGSQRLARHGTGALAETFVLSATVLRHLQADPLLPGPLLPPGWPGRPLRRSYEQFDKAFTRVWTTWYRS